MIIQIIKYRTICLTGVTLTITLAASLSVSTAFEKLTTGQQTYVACKTVPVHNAPTAFSPMSESKAFGDVVTISELAGLFALPDSDYESRKKLEQANARARKQGQTPKTITEADFTRPTWVKIGNKQYVTASCLVGAASFKEQDIETAEKKVAAVITTKAKRNFSEEESGDLRAMRGAAGKAVGGKANFVAVDQLIDDAQGRIDPAAQRAFRQAGHLGEYK